MKKTVLLLFILSQVNLFAQNLSSTGKLIQGGVADGEKLVKAYLKPLNEAIVFGLSGVNFTTYKNSADNKKFTLGVKAAIVHIPTEDLIYDVSKLGLQYIEAKDPNQTIAPTVFGDSIHTIRLASKKRDIFGRPIFEFDAPTGKQSNFMPLPMLSLGYRMNSTVIHMNFIPYVKVPTTDMNIGMLGTSVQQGADAFIKALKDKNYGIDLQAGAAFLYGHEKLSIEPGGVYIPVTTTGNQTGPYDNQKINIYYTNFNFNIYTHYTFAQKYTFFAGTGFAAGTTNINVLGRYPVYSEDPSHTGAVVADDVDDPLSINENFSQTQIEAGFQAEWNKILLEIRYSIAKYGGLGINLSYKL